MSSSLLTAKGAQVAATKQADPSKETPLSLPWEEKYRGKTLNEIILPPSIRRMVDTALRLNSFGNYVLYSGSPGTGKTSLARAIPNILGTESKFLYGKASEVINEIEQYKMFRVSDGKPRFVIIDEVDKALNPEKFFKELQSVIESSTATLRFILTCNDIWQVRPAIKSRCIPIEFSMHGCTDDEIKFYKRSIFERLEFIVKQEVAAVNGRYERQTIIDTFNACYPDIRSMIVSLHVTFLKNGGNVVGRPSIFASAQTIADIWNYVIRNDARGLRMYLSSNVEDPMSIYIPFSKYAFDRINDRGLFSFGKITADALADTRGQVDPETMLYGYLSATAMLVHQVGWFQTPQKAPELTAEQLAAMQQQQQALPQQQMQPRPQVQAQPQPQQRVQYAQPGVQPQQWPGQNGMGRQ